MESPYQEVRSRSNTSLKNQAYNTGSPPAASHPPAYRNIASEVPALPRGRAYLAPPTGSRHPVPQESLELSLTRRSNLAARALHLRHVPAAAPTSKSVPQKTQAYGIATSGGAAATCKTQVASARWERSTGSKKTARHINQGVLPKKLALLPIATGGEHFVDPGTCSVTEAIKLGCENNSPDGRGNKVREQEAGRSLNTLLLGHDGPASGKRPPSLIAANLETTHSLVAPSALERHANEAAQKYLATIERKVCENFV